MPAAPARSRTACACRVRRSPCASVHFPADLSKLEYVGRPAEHVALHKVDAAVACCIRGGASFHALENRFHSEVARQRGDVPDDLRSEWIQLENSVPKC